MAARGVRRFQAPTFGPIEAVEIATMLRAGRHTEVNDRLVHLVHAGVPPGTLFEMAMSTGWAERDKGPPG
jgi:hypothetical protein